MYSLMSKKDNRAAVWFTVQTIVQGIKPTVGQAEAVCESFESLNKVKSHSEDGNLFL